MTSSRPTPIESTTHADTRINIPTEEMRDLVDEQEKKPQTLLYPRDPSLDPQLVWRGKDEQDREDLAVPAVPIYIQEKIHPRALIEDLRAETKKGTPPAEQLGLFADFNGLEGLESIEFYQHDQHWSNRMILGDSLLVMASLAEKEGLKGKVQMIYMDPPYGIKFGSNWQVSTRKRDVRDGNAADVNREPEVIRAFRDTWKLGIHSYLSYLRDRLVLARELLTESGSIFVQIGDENVHLVRSVMDEVFGSENFVSAISFRKTGGATSQTISNVVDQSIWYAKNRDGVKYRAIVSPRTAGSAGSEEYVNVEHSDGAVRRGTAAELASGSALSEGLRIFATDSAVSDGYRANTTGKFTWAGITYDSGPDNNWKATIEPGMVRLCRAGRILRRPGKRVYKRFFDDFPFTSLTNVWMDVRGALERRFVVQTSEAVIQRCLLMTTDPGDLVLDPTCGSGTTAYVAEQWGRRWITTDTSRVALALARTRLMTARFLYYVLADSPEGVRKETEVTGLVPPQYKTSGDIKKGFVYKRVPHITLKAIANNEEIDVIHERWQPQLDDLLARLNAARSGVREDSGVPKPWPEWEVPREALTPNPSPSAQGEGSALLAEWWELRRKRQAEIDASIARRADVELLYDQPYEDNQRVRVTGPFTVESLSPHRMISVEDKAGAASEGVETSDGRVAVQVRGPDDFGLMIIDHLWKTGVQNGIKQERLAFERLDPFPGEWIHAAGEYLEDGQAKRVAVCIGPEFGTVGPDLVKEAAKEAVRGVGFDLLLVCGFAFDPHVSEEAKRYGTLTVLPTKMNPDLAMGDELLKKTGAGNLFMVFGEPDITITAQSDRQLVVEIRGLDVYDPTTGEIRGGIAVDEETGRVLSDSRNDIAAWFVDTDYNAESFFVRHAYFTGADKPYEKLQRTLRAEINEDAWASLYSTRSRPFPRPETGRIAVKVINHYGDEVLKVYEV
jgi:adenine-specific DNA-methyltransferase